MDKDYGIARVLEDYKFGLLHLVSHKDASETSLLFALFELFPTGVECDELSYVNLEQAPVRPVAGVDTYHLVEDSVLQYCRKKLQAADLLKMYYDLGEEDKLIWHKDEICVAHDMRELQPWPCLDLISSNSDDIEYPYLAQCWDYVRAHHLFAAGKETKVGEILKFEKPTKWLEERLGWDLGQYPDLWGSAHLVLPNPLFSHLGVRCVRPENDSEKWEIRLSFNIYQPDKTFKVLIETLEKHITGLSAHRPLELTISNSHKQVDIPLIREPEQIALAISNPERGLVACQPFTGFLKNISINFGFGMREKLVFNVGDKQHTVERTSGEYSKINLGERKDNANLGKMIQREQITRSARKRAQKKGEVFINGAEPALEKIQKIISWQADLIIIDSSFTFQDFEKYILPVCPDNAAITIITENHENCISNDDKRMSDLCDVFIALKQYKNLRISLLLQPMSAKLAGTFIVTGGKNVWQIGCTLGELEAAATVISPMEDSQPLINMLDLLIPQCVSVLPKNS